MKWRPSVCAVAICEVCLDFIECVQIRLYFEENCFFSVDVFLLRVDKLVYELGDDWLFFLFGVFAETWEIKHVVSFRGF